MRVQLAQQAKEILGQSDLVIITERVDDVALLIGQMVKMGLPEVLDRHIPRHWTQRGISWGWTAVVWLAYIVTEGDHRKVSVEAYLKGMHHTLSRLTAQVIEPLDFSDDRLSHLLKHLSQPAYWHQIEHDLNARSIEGYDLSQGVIRCDATTVSGEHEVTAGGLLQFGHSKDDPTRPQIKVMMGSLDPLGMPLATDVASGTGLPGATSAGRPRSSCHCRGLGGRSRVGGSGAPVRMARVWDESIGRVVVTGARGAGLSQ